MSETTVSSHLIRCFNCESNFNYVTTRKHVIYKSLGMKFQIMTSELINVVFRFFLRMDARRMTDGISA